MKEFLFSKLTRRRLDAFIASYASDSYTLDIGCANSPYSTYFPHRVGFDIHPGVGVDIVGDAHDLPFKDEEFEQILCTEVLEHLHTPEKAIGEMYRVLKNGGRLILTTRFLFPIHDAPNDCFRYTEYGLRHLLRDFKIIKLEAEASEAETFAILIQRLSFDQDRNYIIRIFLALLARLIHKCAGFKSAEKQEKMTSGYYLIAKKI